MNQQHRLTEIEVVLSHEHTHREEATAVDQMAVVEVGMVVEESSGC